MKPYRMVCLPLLIFSGFLNGIYQKRPLSVAKLLFFCGLLIKIALPKILEILYRRANILQLIFCAAQISYKYSSVNAQQMYCFSLASIAPKN